MMGFRIETERLLIREWPESDLAPLRFAFERARLERVAAIAQPGNHASIRVMDSLGMLARGRRRGDALGLRHPDVEVGLYVAERARPALGVRS